MSEPTKEEISVFAYIDDYISGLQQEGIAQKEGLNEKAVNEAIDRAWNALYLNAEDIKTNLYEGLAERQKQICK